MKDEYAHMNVGKVGSIILPLQNTFIGGPFTIFQLGFQAEGLLIVSATRVFLKRYLPSGPENVSFCRAELYLLQFLLNFVFDQIYFRTPQAPEDALKKLPKRL